MNGPTQRSAAALKRSRGSASARGFYMPLQQHLSTVFLVSVQSILPFFCTSQQHFDTSLPVNVQVIFAGAAEAVAKVAIVARTASD